MTRELRERVARCLGWTVEDTRRFSDAYLREIVRPKSPKLAYFIAEEIRTGTAWLGVEDDS